MPTNTLFMTGLLCVWYAISATANPLYRNRWGGSVISSRDLAPACCRSARRKPNLVPQAASWDPPHRLGSPVALPRSAAEPVPGALATRRNRGCADSEGGRSLRRKRPGLRGPDPLRCLGGGLRFVARRALLPHNFAPPSSPKSSAHTPSCGCCALSTSPTGGQGPAPLLEEGLTRWGPGGGHGGGGALPVHGCSPTIHGELLPFSHSPCSWKWRCPFRSTILSPIAFRWDSRRARRSASAFWFRSGAERSPG